MEQRRLSPNRRRRVFTWSNTMRFGLFAALLTASCLSARAVAAPSPEPAKEPKVTISKGVPFPEALSALCSESHCLIVAQPGALPLQLEHDITAQSLTEALDAFSTSFHCHWQLAGDTLVLLPRPWSPGERIEVEVEEIRAITADLERLTGGLCPYPRDLSRITDKIAFVKTIRPEQADAMQSGGLPFTALEGEQQKLWLKINGMEAFETPTTEAARLAEAFRSWERATLSIIGARNLDGATLNFVGVDYPNRYERGNRGRLDLGSLEVPGPQARTVTVQPSGGAVVPRPRGLPSNFTTNVLKLSGEYTLRELADRLQEATHTRIEIPPYAVRRRLLAYAASAPASEAAGAICECFGWVLEPQGGNGWYLGRPRLVATDNPALAWPRLRAAIPPILRLLYAHRYDPARGSREIAAFVEEQAQITAGTDLRRYAERSALLKQVETAKGKDWGRVPLAELSPEFRQRLANYLLEGALQLMSAPVRLDSPPPSVMYTASGVFRLSGPLGPGQHPLLTFNVTRADGTTSRWGWAVGTSSLEKQ